MAQKTQLPFENKIKIHREVTMTLLCLNNNNNNKNGCEYTQNV